MARLTTPNGYTPIKGDSKRRVIDPNGNIISRGKYQKILHGGLSPEKAAALNKAQKPAPKYTTTPQKTPNGKVYHITPVGKTTVRDQWTTNPKPGTIPQTTPSMWRVRRLFGEVGKKRFYTVGITGRLKRSGEVLYPEEDAPTVTKSVVLPYRDAQELMFSYNNTLDFANALTSPYDYEWYKIYTITVMEHRA